MAGLDLLTVPGRRTWHHQGVDVPLIQIDAFADRVFGGNPAAVMPLPDWLPDTVLQDLAAENNLSETAFLVAQVPPSAPSGPEGLPAFHLRWFTPSVEVDLCGHATLATAGYLFEDVVPGADRLAFWSRSGWLVASRAGTAAVTLDFPVQPVRAVEPDPVVTAALGITPTECWAGTDLMYVVDSAVTVRGLQPDFSALRALAARGVVVTAAAEPAGQPGGSDFVSRWFGGSAGIGEDPVTGSAHCQLMPYWAERLGRSELVAAQVSARGGVLRCRLVGDRVLLTGGHRRYLDGVVHLPG